MRLVIFDLDGTLIDSKRDLVNAVNATRAHYGMPALPAELIASYVGNGAPVLVRRALGPEAGEAELARAIEFFLGYYRDHMLDFTTLYPGVRETLGELRGRGTDMAVLTNKPVRFSQALIEGLGLRDHFFRVYGGNSFEQKKPDPIGVRTLLEETGAAPADTLMVGDSAIDVLTARNAGIKACGVTYGFQPDTLEIHPPDYLIDAMPGLMRLSAFGPS